MATHLRAHNIWNFVETGLAEEASDTARRRDQLVYHRFNKELIDYSIFSIIINAKTAKGVWDILKFSYKGVEKAQKSKLQSLWRKYKSYEMSSSKSMEQYFSRVTYLVNKMRVYREDIPNNKVVDKFLHTMLMKFDHVVTMIIESHNTYTLT